MILQGVYTSPFQNFIKYQRYTYIDSSKYNPCIGMLVFQGSSVRDQDHTF